MEYSGTTGDGLGPRIGNWPRDWRPCVRAATAAFSCRRSTRCCGTGARVRRLFGFDQVLEIFKPAAQRAYGYYCLPVPSGERLVARLDLKADRGRGVLRVLSCRFGGTANSRPAASRDGESA